MNDLYKNKKGFTLIELILVIGIMAILATFSVNSYIQYRKSILLDLNVDNIISQFLKAHSSTFYGRFDGDRAYDIRDALNDNDNDDKILISQNRDSSLCHGIYFKKNNEEDYFNMYEFKSEFSNKKKWKSVVGGEGDWYYESCVNPEFDSNNSDFRPLDLDDSIVVKEMRIGSSTDVFSGDSFYFMAEPPNANWIVSDNVSNGVSNNISLLIGYKNDPLERYEKTINLNFKENIFESEFNE